MNAPVDPRHPPPARPSPGAGTLEGQLRALAQPAASTRDLWPGIEARLARDVPSRAPTARGHRARPRRQAGWLALAASLLVAAGLGWRQHAATDAGQPPLAAGVQAPPMLQRQADAMALEYAAALHEVQREVQRNRVPPVNAEALAELDRSVRAIRAALAEDPHARFLLDHLRRVYARRLDLTRRTA